MRFKVRKIFVLIICLSTITPCWAETVYTNSSLKKYDSYKGQSTVKSYTSHKYPESSPSTTGGSGGISRQKNITSTTGNHNSQIKKLYSEIKAIDQKIKKAERATVSKGRQNETSFMNSSARSSAMREVKNLRKQRAVLQNQINDLEMIQAGANPSVVMSNRQAARNAERAQEEREKKDFSDGFDDAIVGIPPKSYDGQYYDGYLSGSQSR